MTTIASLPDELLFCIFDHVDSIAQLAACRLVCRKWNPPAETSMFGKKITIKSEKQAIVLYGHLCRDPSKGRLIKHLDFNILTNKLPVIYQYLLGLAFTPSIEKLTGDVRAKNFFTTLINIADTTNEEFLHLEQLPQGPVDDLLETMARFGLHSLLVEGDLLAEFNATTLEKFSHLTVLEISGPNNRDWQKLETPLRYCPHLVVLKFVGLELGYTYKSITEVSKWLATNVVKQMNLQRLEFRNSTIDAGLAEYLKFKYPNIKVTKCDEYSELGDRYSTSADLNRILNALRDLHVDQATLILEEPLDLRWSLEFAQSREEDIKFQIDQRRNLVMKIKFAQKEN